MDQEGGRRRSSRLAARGVVATPKAEVIVKKTNVKSSEKPKRSKRKTTEETIELPEPKKSKTEDKVSSDEVEENEVDNVVKNDISGISPMDVEEINVSPPSIKDKKDLPKIEEKTAVPLEDSKDEVDQLDKVPVTNVDIGKVNTSVKSEDDTEKDNASVETKDAQENVNVSIENDDKKKEVEIKVETDNEKPEIEEDLIKMKNPEITEQPKNDVSQEEPKQEPVALENTNGKSDEKEAIEAKEEIVKNDIGFCSATVEDIVTPNGDTDEQVKSTNGNESIIKTEAIEPIKVLHVESGLKAVSATAAISTNNDPPIVEKIEKELDKSADTVVDNKIVSADDNAPKVDQLSTVVS